MKKIKLLLFLLVVSTASYSFSLGGIIKDGVNDVVNDTVKKQLYSISKTKTDISSDGTSVEISGVMKNKGPKTGSVSIKVPCYDVNGAKVGDTFAIVNSIDAKGEWNFNSTLSTSKSAKISRCDLGKAVVDGF